jgi:hypothetical protein
MTDDVASAPAPEAVVSEAPAEAQVEPQTAPDTSQPAEKADAPAKSAREALAKAFETVDKGEAAPKDHAKDAKPAEKPAEDGARERNPDGTFKAKAEPEKATQEPSEAEKAKTDDPLKNFSEAPNRFSPDAKAAWKEAPEPVRAEITRAVTELEKGLDQYRQAFEPYKDFDQQLRQTGQDFRQVVQHYTGIENMLRQDPMRGLDTICQNMGTSLREVAERVLGQQPDQNAAQSEHTIRELRNEIASLKQGFDGLNKDITSRTQKTVESAVLEFAGQPEYARFEELAPDIKFILDGKLRDKVEQAQMTGKFDAVLQEAYQLAERLNPGPQPAPAPAPPPVQPHTQDKGQLSTSGAPSSGSNPGNRPVPANARDALKNAFATVGI